MTTANCRYLARVSIEFNTPFHVSAGRGDNISDAVILVDANRLPAIPGSSLAGMLRAAYRAKNKNRPDAEDAADYLFGFQKKNDGHGSRISISWANIHDSTGKVIDGLVDPDVISKDPVLSCAMNPTLRDHVRISHKGAADTQNMGKFDEYAVCAGHRFTFECEFKGTKQDEFIWKEFLDLLSDSSLRIGGRTRRGFGAFKVVSLKTKIFDLAKKDDFEAYLRHSPRLSDQPSDWHEINVTTTDNAIIENDRCLSLKLYIEPCGFWFIGGGDDIPYLVNTDPNNTFSADMAPVRDRRIHWIDNKGKVIENCFVIPASSIKGAISHRLAYHYNAICQNFADKIENPLNYTGSANLAVQTLFGSCKDSSTTNSKNQRGNVLINDIFLDTNEYKQQLVQHVAINRFTGGAMSGALFSERPIWQGPKIPLQIHFTEHPKNYDKKIQLALKRTIVDLCEARLQLGSGSGRGNGFFRSNSSMEWSDKGAWFNSLGE